MIIILRSYFLLYYIHCGNVKSFSTKFIVVNPNFMAYMMFAGEKDCTMFNSAIGSLM